MPAELLDQPQKTRPGEELDGAKLEAFLRQALPGLDGPTEIEQYPKGYSNLTYLAARRGTGTGFAPPAVRRKNQDRPRHGTRIPHSFRISSPPIRKSRGPSPIARMKRCSARHFTSWSE